MLDQFSRTQLLFGQEGTGLGLGLGGGGRGHMVPRGRGRVRAYYIGGYPYHPPTKQ